MDAGLTPWAGYVYMLTSLLTVTAADTILIKAEPPAVEFGHPLMVNCSSSCAAASILMEGTRGYNETKQPQWLAHSYSTVQSWSHRVSCGVECPPGKTDRSLTIVPVYNRELNITSPPEVLEINTTYSLECTGPRVYPNNKLILKWQRGNEIIQTNSTEEKGIPNEDKRLRNVLQFTARTTDDGQVYTCVAEVDLGSNTTLQITNASVTLQTYREPRSTMISVNNQSSSADENKVEIKVKASTGPVPSNTHSPTHSWDPGSEADENKVEIKVKDGQLCQWFKSQRTRCGRLSHSLHKSGSASKPVTERQQWIVEKWGFVQNHIVQVERNESGKKDIRPCVISSEDELDPLEGPSGPGTADKQVHSKLKPAHTAAAECKESGEQSQRGMFTDIVQQAKTTADAMNALSHPRTIHERNVYAFSTFLREEMLQIPESEWISFSSEAFALARAHRFPQQ